MLKLLHYSDQRYFNVPTFTSTTTLLRYTSVIRGFIAGLLLMIFSISTVPKSYIHNAIADHRDLSNACHHKTHSVPCIKAATVDCHFTNLVVNIPYHSCTQEYTFHSAIPRAIYILHPFESAARYPSLHKESRGPPAWM
jgi:hypothetical protein